MFGFIRLECTITVREIVSVSIDGGKYRCDVLRCTHNISKHHRCAHCEYQQTAETTLVNAVRTEKSAPKSIMWHFKWLRQKRCAAGMSIVRNAIWQYRCYIGNCLFGQYTRIVERVRQHGDRVRQRNQNTIGYMGISDNRNRLYPCIANGHRCESRILPIHNILSYTMAITHIHSSTEP